MIKKKEMSHTVFTLNARLCYFSVAYKKNSIVAYIKIKKTCKSKSEGKLSRKAFVLMQQKVL